MTDTQLDPFDLIPSRKRGRRISAGRNAVEWALIIIGALLVAFAVKTWLIQAFYIPSPSMVPTLQVKDRVLVNKLSYDLHDVNRGDVVVFERPKGEASSPEIKDLIKRVVGLPGEKLEAKEGKLFINGQPLEEPYLPEGTTTEGLEPIEVPLGHVFVMGDNRGNSSDSRRFGPIDEDTIVGRAFVLVWPLKAFRTL